MKFTLDLPDYLVELGTLEAAKRNMTFGELFELAVRREIAEPESPAFEEPTGEDGNLQ